MYNEIKDYLEEQKEEKLFRELKTIKNNDKGYIYIKNKKYLDLSSNDYLSISDHPHLIKRSMEFTEKYGTGGRASRLLSGNFEYHIMLEEKIAELKNKKAGLIFGNGYIANTTVIPALSGRDTIIFADRLVHASIIDGIILSRSKFFRFHHNDIGHLEQLVERERNKYKNVLIITESLFSMDGDKAPLKDIVELKEKYDALLYVDEAHATGIFSHTGSGLVEEEGLSDKCDIIMGTFSKALGSYGAYITTSELMKEYLINKARGFIFSTALPPSVIGASIAGIELLKKEPNRREELLDKCEYFRKKLLNEGLEVAGDSQIIPIITGDTEKTVYVAEELLAKGCFVLPIRPPTVPEGSSRLRLSVTYDHPVKALDKVVELLISIK